MTAPLKPWEQAALNSSSSVEYSLSPAHGRPQVPPRPPINRAMGSSVKQYRPVAPISAPPYSGFGFGGMGSYGSLGSYGPYGGYGNFGYGFRGTYDDTFESRWIQRVEEGARPTFDSIESVVRVFGSMASMLDSTFFAVTNTFRALLAVTENFGRLRSMFGRIWTSVALFRSISALYRAIREKLGLVSKSDTAKDAWKEAVNATVNEAMPKSSGLPALLFLGAVIAAPYILSRIYKEPQEKKEPGEVADRGIQANALYEFRGVNSGELCVRPGDAVLIAPKHVQDSLGLTDSGWVQASANGQKGIIPFNYVQPTSVNPAPRRAPPNPARKPHKPISASAFEPSVPAADTAQTFKLIADETP